MFTGETAVNFVRLVSIAAAPTRGLMRLFAVRPGNVSVAEDVQYDISQSAEVMSIPVKRGDRPTKNTGRSFQTVTETPPYYSESALFNVADLKGRFPGVDKYAAADRSLTQDLIAYMSTEFLEIQQKLDRQIEWQAAQILQKGKLPFSDFDPLVPQPVDDIDFKMNQTNLFTTSGVSWDTATGKQMRADLLVLCKNIRKGGKSNPTDIILGENANERFWNQAENLELLDNRRTEIGMRAPQALQADGFALEGEMKIGPYRMRFWTYTGFYKDPVTGVDTDYIDPANAIVFAENAQRDRFHAGVDVVIPADAESLALIPGVAGLDSIATRQAIEFMPWAFTDNRPGQKGTSIGLDAAVLLVPTNRAGHGSLDTQAT